MKKSFFLVVPLLVIRPHKKTYICVFCLIFLAGLSVRRLKKKISVTFFAIHIWVPSQRSFEAEIDQLFGTQV